MEFFGYFLAILIGISLGLIGGGGSILTVPVLVYLLKVDPLQATTYSLFIVGLTSLVGGAKAFTRRQVDFTAVSLFGFPSILTVFLARHFIVPAIPEHIFRSGSLDISRGGLLMIVFSLLMLAASFSMMRSREPETLPAGDEVSPVRILSLLVPGLLVGLVTGILGAGGGFLIIPALVLIVKLPMKTAVGTSLIIIAINSGFGFVFSLGHYSLQWPLMIIFTIMAIVGVFLGGRMAQATDGEALKKYFGWLVMAMGLYILVRELFFS
jgi:uncharacterized protein